jgi:glycosyltransferase involved in cell wall biosynthesis
MVFALGRGKTKMKKRVVIDARMIGPTLHGVARYVKLMALGLKELKLSYEPVFLVNRGVWDAFGFETDSIDTDYLHPSELWKIPAALSRLKADLYHSPSLSSLVHAPCPWMMTLHDLNHLHFGSFSQKLYYHLILKRFARNSRALLTVSEFSKKEISEWLGKDPHLIEVVYNALDPDFVSRSQETNQNSTQSKYGLKSGKYFFCLSNPKPHKNVQIAVEAYHAFLRQQQTAGEWQLVLSLPPEALGKSLGPNVLALGSLPEIEVRALLSGAGALIFPSLYEGFGLPPVEAAVSGVRVIVSRIPAHQEALQTLSPEEAIWVDPKDFHGWVSAFHRVFRGELSSPSADSRRTLCEKYSVSRLGQNMDQIYRRVLGL